MAALDLQYDLANLTPANAAPVQANFSRVETYINQEVIRRDGAVAMTGQLQLVGDPVAPLDAVTKAYADAILPLGVILPYGGATVPGGGRWALANGASLSTVVYADLFAVYGYSHGGSGGSFLLPNWAGRMPLGVGGAVGAALGATGGSKDAIVVSHSHSIDHQHATSTTGGESGHYHGLGGHVHSGTTSTVGDHQHRQDPSGGAAFVMVSGGSVGFTLGAGSQTVFSTGPYWDGPNGSHNHTFSTGGPNTTSDWATQTHTHAFTTPHYAGSATNTGASGTGANMPPYGVCNFIVRVQ